MEPNNPADPAITQPAPAPAPETAAPAAVAGADASSRRILIADDDESLRKLYEVELTNKGYFVILAKDGDEAVQKAMSEKPDLMLLDVMMPNRDGMATLKALKSDPTTASLPIVMLTNFGQEDLVKNALNLGAVDYMLKYRLTPAEMSTKIGQILSPVEVHL